MRIYSFSLVNHLGERFRTQTAQCDDDQAAITLGKHFEGEGYPVEVHLDGRRVALSSLPPWTPEPWLRHLL
jgi:hypothetical protein